MPEAAIYKNSNFAAHKNEIWMSREIGVPLPARKPVLAHDFHHALFSCDVSMAANRCHDLGALRGGNKREFFHRRPQLIYQSTGERCWHPSGKLNFIQTMMLLLWPGRDN